ncbi:hypothetical protein ACXDTJ_003753 [Klebsiella quasipneumoniae]
MSRKSNPYRDELKIAQSQFRRLKTMASKLTDMAVEWDGLCGGLECDFNILAKEVEKQLDVLDAQIKDWAEGFGDGREMS